jgi:hypothetical protein
MHTFAPSWLAVAVLAAGLPAQEGAAGPPPPPTIESLVSCTRSS